MFKERDVIEACKRHDSYAQEVLYKHFLPIVYIQCKHYISDPDEIDDVMQEGFIKVFTSIKTFRYEGSFEGWIKHIFINTAINHIRKNKKYRLNEKIDYSIQINQDINDENDQAFYGSRVDKEDINSVKVDFELVTAANFSEKELMDALNGIPDIYRIAFSLFCIEKLSHEEIGEMLKIDIATSRSRLKRARRMLRKTLYEKSIDRITTNEK